MCVCLFWGKKELSLDSENLCASNRGFSGPRTERPHFGGRPNFFYYFSFFPQRAGKGGERDGGRGGIFSLVPRRGFFFLSFFFTQRTAPAYREQSFRDSLLLHPDLSAPLPAYVLILIHVILFSQSILIIFSDLTLKIVHFPMCSYSLDYTFPTYNTYKRTTVVLKTYVITTSTPLEFGSK